MIKTWPQCSIKCNAILHSLCALSVLYDDGGRRCESFEKFAFFPLFTLILLSTFTSFFYIGIQFKFHNPKSFKRPNTHIDTF